MRNGFGQADWLESAVREWWRQFERSQAGHVITEFAPAALLAARLADLPRADLGTGFTVPPAVRPMASMQPWLKLRKDHLEAADRRLVEAVNPVIRRLGGRALKWTADLFEGATRLCCSMPEFDHYTSRPEGHLGLVPPRRQPLTPVWPSGRRPRLFVYMDAHNQRLKGLLKALSQLGLNSLVCVPGWSRSGVVSQPVDLARAARECDLAITHAGHGSTTALLLAGKPVFLCPRSLEQAMLGHRLNAQGLAHSLNFLEPEPDLPGRLEAWLGDEALGRSVRAFAEGRQNAGDALENIRQALRWRPEPGPTPGGQA
ncbi:MAG: hypothetical protein KC910_03900 [Candidatus Eremiobacteraeota bacterium]|nr:hypothetical protein [Candidatus Eremiobacteraeota bacterium]